MIMMVASELPQRSSTRWGAPPQRPERDSRIRRLALAQVRELRRCGLSYREIGRRFGAPRASEQVESEGFEFRLPPEQLLGAEPTASNRNTQPDSAMFLLALDALDQGLVFFDGTGALLHTNRTLARLLESHSEGERLRAEVQHFAASLCGLVRLRDLTKEPHVEELATREVPIEQAHYRLQGSYIGLDLFGEGPSLLIALEKPNPDPLSDEPLRERFGLSRKQCGVLRLLIEGKTNEEIARALFISPHTARHHTEHLLRKLGVNSRAEAAGRVLRV